METKHFRSVLALALTLLVLSVVGCSRTGESRSQASKAQNEQDQDQKTKEEVADATQKAKEKSKELGQQLQVAAQKAEEKAKVVAQGVKEGWNRGGQVLDLNSASVTELQTLPGLNEEVAKKIVAGRPYKTAGELVSRGILTEDQYRHLKNSVSVK